MYVSQPDGISDESALEARTERCVNFRLRVFLYLNAFEPPGVPIGTERHEPDPMTAATSCTEWSPAPGQLHNKLYFDARNRFRLFEIMKRNYTASGKDSSKLWKIRSYASGETL
jgi:hypothetical protein